MVSTGFPAVSFLLLQGNTLICIFYSKHFMRMACTSQPPGTAVPYLGFAWECLTRLHQNCKLITRHTNRDPLSPRGSSAASQLKRGSCFITKQCVLFRSAEQCEKWAASQMLHSIVAAWISKQCKCIRDNPKED